MDNLNETVTNGCLAQSMITALMVAAVNEVVKCSNLASVDADRVSLKSVPFAS